jgi:hypothetical protein
MSRKPASRRNKGTRGPVKAAKTRAKIGRIFTGDEALHELFLEQAAALLDDAEIGEEEKQSILLAMSCPCCGVGSMSVSVKMKPRKGGRFVVDS